MEGDCNKCTKTVRVQREDHFCQTASSEPVSLRYYSRPPVTPCYTGSTRRSKMRSGLDFTRLLSALTVQPSAAQLWVIRNACSCRAPHCTGPLAGRLVQAAGWARLNSGGRGSGLTQASVCDRNTVLSTERGLVLFRAGGFRRD